MKALANLQAFGWFLAYLGLGTAMLAIFTRIYVWLTPYDEVADIRAGKMSPAVALVGSMAGFTAPLLVASLYGTSIRDYLMWGAIACIVQLAAFKCLYWTMPHSIETDNKAAALVFAGASLCLGLINAFSMIP